ncbi:MAG: hypothetical protein ATN34_03090 [Epulopiscium sp. Nele67-Bin002]|nr:MAG: hypothetical protein BEN18_05190 [Epulopiscium sp. Nuni2H_MBin001]OON90350.1 MAG: hypothetical protein ATN33_03260 [Epulopiscium sp. Nele67-Bin001]OON90994.1 MAG: hypothetical protein ATN34_03090 [Epulopiscium sp. Nele67-Bin002]
MDGIILSNIIHELKLQLIGGKIEKIYQPQKEELLVTIRNNRKNYKLLLNANSQYPRLHLTNLSKNESNTPPMFCMLLRKHLIGGKIVDITQPNFERIAQFYIEAKNELGDKEDKVLILEIMGRHSNLILTKENGTILDSIKHISFDKSQVRQILPNNMYVYPPNQSKLNPLLTTREEFLSAIPAKSSQIYKRLYETYNGLSPLVTNEICAQANIEQNKAADTLTSDELASLYNCFNGIITNVKDSNYTPIVYHENGNQPIAYYMCELKTHGMYDNTEFANMSEVIEHVTHNKNQRFNISQKTADIKKMIMTFIDRAVRKQALQQKALDSSDKSELYKIYGELITSYSYEINAGDTEFKCINYYSEQQEEIVIPLNKDKTPIENAQTYFKQYTKLKRTAVAAAEQLDIIKEDLDYLNSVLVSLDMLESETDIMELRQELVDMGYLKKRAKVAKKAVKNQKPYLHFKTTSALDIYVGKNNFQNDALTMKFAKPNDIWLHIKDGPGSHVIIKVPHQHEITEQDLYEGAMLAAYYSSAKQSSHVPIDYTAKKNVKKIPNAKPGMVIYNNFKTISVTPTEVLVRSLECE